MAIRRFMFYLASALTLSAAFAGCGGSGGDSGPPSATGDSFTDRVLAVITTSQENDPPVSTDDIVATTPETTNPAAVQ